jgi:pimeloyl-ACP methyl ester carboxylesterase
MGLDVAQLTLPFHGARATARCHYSGERFASWDIGRLNEAVRQSVHDAHLVARWLTHRNGAPVGALGMSLGGYLTALLAALLPDLAFAIPVVPAVNLGDLPTRLYAQSRAGRAGFAPPLTWSEMQRGYHVHSPLTYPLALPRDRVLIIGARGDAVTPIEHARALWDHWGRPAAIWFSGGHVAPFQRSRVAAAVAAHLTRAGVLDGEHAAAATASPPPPMRLMRFPTRVGPPRALPTPRRASSLQPSRAPHRRTRIHGSHSGAGMGLAAKGAGEGGA